MDNIKQIYQATYEHGCDAFLFLDEVNRLYLTGFSSTEGALLINKNGGTLFLDMRYFEMAERRKSDGSIPEAIEPVLSSLGFTAAIKEYLSVNKIHKLAIDSSRMTVDEYNQYQAKLDVELVALKGICEKLRETKSSLELTRIRQAQKITDQAFNHILRYIKPEITETEIAAEIEYFIRCRGGKLAFETICVAGKNSSLPHGVPSNVPVGNNVFLTMDFGAAYEGYCSDMTRTIVIGNADEEMKKVYNTVLTAQKLALDGMHSGMTGREIDALAREYINNSGYTGLFGHSLGHSLGVEIHESPRFSSSFDTPIPEGCVMSVEPGIYIPGRYGVRIEDIVIVTAHGCENLTSSPKELICL